MAIIAVLIVLTTLYRNVITLQNVILRYTMWKSFEHCPTVYTTNSQSTKLVTRKLCYRKDDRAMRAIYNNIVSRCGDMVIRYYLRWRRPPS